MQQKVKKRIQKDVLKECLKAIYKQLFASQHLHFSTLLDNIVYKACYNLSLLVIDEYLTPKLITIENKWEVEYSLRIISKVRYFDVQYVVMDYVLNRMVFTILTNANESSKVKTGLKNVCKICARIIQDRN